MDLVPKISLLLFERFHPKSMLLTKVWKLECWGNESLMRLNHSGDAVPNVLHLVEQSTRQRTCDSRNV